MSIAKFVFENKDRFMPSAFVPSAHYDIGDLEFYISNKFGSNNQVFLIMKSEKNLYEIVELCKAGAQGTNVLYKVPVNQALRTNGDQVSTQVLVLNCDTDTYIYSPIVKIFIDTKNYSLARQIHIAKQVGQATQQCYIQMLALSEQMKQLYEKIQEGDK